jgi:hypothetical protein
MCLTPKKCSLNYAVSLKRKYSFGVPHKRGSGAKRPHHLTYIDEAWFTDAAQSIGVAHCERITAVDFPISNRLPPKLVNRINKGFAWRVFRHAEFVLGIPYEVECEVNKASK